MKIKEIFIKNFRSIRSMTLQTKDFNVFVGENDVGKSNILRALNLFFNNQTDNGASFNFDSDFSYFFPKSSHSPKEIRITIKFEVPETYKESGIITWEKVWRRDVAVKESLTNEKGDELSARSRVESALRRIRFRYVPAVKSRDYYKDLLVELYNTISISLNAPLAESTDAFSQALRDYTESLSANVFQTIGIQSVLTIPQDLKEIFKSLIFETKSNNSSIPISLNVRGDGIQARHIPVILNYIAEQDKRTRNKGSMRVFTIWGYEEPENGLEMSKCFEMADEFIKYTDDIQIFTTTHSPAFYMKKSEGKTSVFFIHKDKESEETKCSISRNDKELDEQMGLMPLVAPYIQEQENRVRVYKDIFKTNFLVDVDTIVVEGKTDRKYLERAFEIENPQLFERLKNNSLRILTKDDGCGVTQLHDWALAWCYSGFEKKLLILFDRDNAGKETKQKLEKNEVYKTKNSNKKINIQLIQPSADMINLMNKKVRFEMSVENLLSIDVWILAKKKRYLQARELSDLRKMFVDILPLDKTIYDLIEETIDDKKIRDTLINMYLLDKNKDKFCDLAIELSIENPAVFSGFKRTVDKIYAFLSS